MLDPSQAGASQAAARADPLACDSAVRRRRRFRCRTRWMSGRAMRRRTNHKGRNTSALLLALLLALGGGAAAYWFLLRPGTVVVTVSPDREFAVLVDGKPMPGMDSSPVILSVAAARDARGVGAAQRATSRGLML